MISPNTIKPLGLGLTKLYHTTWIYNYKRKIEFLQNELGVGRITAASYLNQLAADKVLIKHKVGQSNYYINTKLMDALLKS